MSRAGNSEQGTGNRSAARRLYLGLVRSVSAPRSWWRAMRERARFETEMEAELADHLERLTADLVRAGFKPVDAKRRARIALGSTVVHKDAMRGSVGLKLWDDLFADIRYASRRLRRSVGFTAVAVVSLAMAIGANTTIFSLAKHLLYDRLGVPRSTELRLLRWTSQDKNSAVEDVWGDYNSGNGRITSSSFSYPVYEQLREQNRIHKLGIEDLIAFKETGMNGTVAGLAQQVQVEMVSGNYYSQLEVKPVLGRVITASDDAQVGQGTVAVMSYGMWQRSFSGSPTAIGQTVRLNNIPLTIIGVNPKEFTGAKGTQQSPDFFIPISMQPVIIPHGKNGSRLTDPKEWWMNIMGRVKPGVTSDTLQAQFDGPFVTAARATLNPRPDHVLPHMVIRDGSRGLFYQENMFVKPMQVLLTMVGFVLLLACANIANLMLARGAQRHREMSVRLALGAGRLRIARQMLVESLMLAFLGGIGGLMIGYIGSILVPKLTENAWQRTDFRVPFDWKVFAFTAAITLVTGILFGLAPALSAARAKVSSGLKETSQSVTRRRKGWGGRSLVCFQIALSTLLVVGAGLFLRTLSGLNSVDPGFRTDHLLLSEIDAPQKLYPPGKDIELYTRLTEGMAAVPGVEAVSPVWVTYLSESMNIQGFTAEGEVKEKDKNESEDFNVVGNSFFSMLKIPIVEGRAFGPQDTSTSTKVGIINRALAKKRFPGQNPIGKRFKNNDETDASGAVKAPSWITIVGVCNDVRYSDLRNESPPQFYLPFAQQKEVGGGLSYLVTTHMDPEAVVPALRRVVQQLDPDLPLTEVRTQEQQIAELTQQERVFVAMTSSFGMLALALASVGIYGIMAYSVSNRTNEIGIRLALGAQPRQVLSMILREATWISVAGVTVGIGAALLLARLVKTMLYGLEPWDPVSMISGATILLAVGLAASWIPARRAASVQPVEALRHE